MDEKSDIIWIEFHPFMKGLSIQRMTIFYEMAPLTTSPSVHRMAIYSKIPIHTKLVKIRRHVFGLTVRFSEDVIWQTELGVFAEKETTVPRQLIPSAGVPIHTGNDSSTPTPLAEFTKVSSHANVVSPEFVNYVLALVIYSIRYPAVFWYSKMAFSFVFSFMLLLATAHYIVSYCIAAVSYKLAFNLAWSASLSLVLSPAAGIVLFLSADAILFLSAISIFNYGYLHYNEAHKKYLRRYRKSGRLSPPPTGCQGYFPHTLATASLVLFVALRGPMVYDSVTIYRNLNHTIALASIIFDVSYMLIWISLWFCLTVKQEWSFKILAFTFHSSISFSDIFTIQNDHVSESTSSLNGSLPNGHVYVLNKNLKNKKSKAASHQNSQYPGFEMGLGSPTSALRKSGERKQNRVTFEDSRDENDGPDAMVRTPERSSKERQRQPKPDQTSDCGTTPQDTPENMRRKYKRELASKIHNIEAVVENNDGTDRTNDDELAQDVSLKRKVNRSIFGDFELSETPENTLKRNYRNSLRSKCGQYYRNSRDFASPPTAQSSPVLPAKHAAEQGEIQDSSPNKAHHNNNGLPYVFPGRPPARQSSSGRPSTKKDKCSLTGRTGYTSFSNPVVADSSCDDLSRSANITYSHSSSCSSGLHSPRLPYHGAQSYNNPVVQSPSHGPKVMLSHLPPPAPQNSATKRARQHSGRGKPLAPRTKITSDREIQNVDSKPEMGRRDSALPSSNETSSNDSQDVLCSQV